MKELVPKISRAAVLSNSAFRANAARWKPTQDAARQLGVTLLPAEIRGPDDLENAFAIMVQGRAEGFAINIKTAKALGLTIPPSLLLRADQVIDQ